MVLHCNETTIKKTQRDCVWCGGFISLGEACVHVFETDEDNETDPDTEEWWHTSCWEEEK